MKKIISLSLRYLLSLIVMMYMYRLFYLIVEFFWALFATYLPFLLAMIPPLLLWIFSHYMVSSKVLKPLNINGYYYLIVNMLALIYTLSLKYLSYYWFLEQHRENSLSTGLLHSIFLLEVLLACVAFILIISTWNKFYRRVKS